MSSVPATDPRRRIPRTDQVLDDPRLQAAAGRVGRPLVKQAVLQAQSQARSGHIAPEDVVEAAVEALPAAATTARRVLNATGVVLHTNIGRAPLSAAAVEALVAASGYTDLEYSTETGERARRGRGTLAALRAAVPAAGDVHVVNNGAAALLLATTALAAGGQVLISRGEMVEIGDGFRLPDLIASTGAHLREVGTTNRTSVADYEAAMGPQVGCILKVHPSNFRVTGFTSQATVRELAALADGRVPVVVDIGSGLLHPDALLPEEPDASSVLTDGAALVTASGDKLLGGPQAGLLLGEAALVEQLRRHPLARALRVDKLTLAALEATVAGPVPPATQYLHARPERLRARTQALAETVGGTVVGSAGAVGGGGAPGLSLPGWAVALPESYAQVLRRQDPALVCRVEGGRTLVDLRCVPESEDQTVAVLVRAVTDAGSAQIPPRGSARPGPS